MDCGEQGLLPAVRDAGPDTFVVADGFSCKTQIADAGTGREALHVAQLMKLARERGRSGGATPGPRGGGSVFTRPAPSLLRRSSRVAAVLATGLAAALAGALATDAVVGGAAAGSRAGHRTTDK
jgi:hypothetical protein